MDKKTIIALVLIFVIYWVSTQFLWKNNKEQPVIDETQTEEITETTNETVTDKPIEEEETVVSEQTYENESEIEINNNIVLENDKFRLVFTNLGSKLKTIILDEYYLSDKTTNINLIPDGEYIMGINMKGRDNYFSLKNTPFNYEYFETNDGKGITFYIEQNGKRTFSQKYEVANGSYEVKYDIILDDYQEITGYEIGFASGMPDTEEFIKNKTQDYKVVAQIDNAISKNALSKLKERKELTGKIDWAAVRTKYFALGIIPDKRINMDKIDAFVYNNSTAMRVNINYNTGRTDAVDSYRLYLGPLDYQILKHYTNGFENVAELGAKWLQFISRFFLLLLSALHKFIPNYGVCIIIFSIILKIVLYPLTHKSLESSQKMQKINPLMKEIQKKYKDDARQMQAEMSKLYKEHGVSPLGGCLPLLLQMPIFFSLYPVLRYSIELRQAHFMFWVRDLSEPDPYWVLPILMGIFMFIQQKFMTPPAQDQENMDEKQKAAMQSQKMMMYMMPIVMFFLFKSFPAGLVLYWMFYNVLSIVQHYFIKKKLN